MEMSDRGEQPREEKQSQPVLLSDLKRAVVSQSGEKSAQSWE